jgi:hypothetical protein
MHPTSLLLLAASLPLLAAGCGSTGTQPQAPDTIETTTTSTTAISPAAAACFARPAASGDILVRLKTPLDVTAEELGGGWAWNYRTNTCMTSTDMTIATARLDQGYCTQVALVSDNPGYNPEAKPAARLKKVIASAGGPC